MQRFGTQRCALLAALCHLAPAGAWGADDAALHVIVGKSLAASAWQEFDPSGRRLVSESGTLAGSHVAIQVPTGAWLWTAQWSEAAGARDYTGETSLGQPAQSSARVRYVALQGAVSYRWSTHWSTSLGLAHESTWRDIASSGSAAGYPERYAWTLINAGAQWSIPLGSSELLLGASMGRGVGSTLELTLPGRDSAQLALGTLQRTQGYLAWHQPLSASCSLHLRAAVQRTEMGAGDEAVITRSGVPVAVAHQPRTAISERPFAIELQWSF